MNWRRTVRIALAVIGIGTAVTIVVVTRDRPAPDRPPVTTPVDPEATLQAGRGADLRFRGDRQVGRISYEGVRQYPDGRMGWEKAQLQLESGMTLAADVLETKGKAVSGDQPSDLIATGHVRLTTSESATLTGEAATYSEATGLATMSGAVTFSRGRMSGTGTGGTYEQATGMFRVLADPRVVIGGETADDQMAAMSDTMTFMRDGNAMLFDGNARLTRGPDAMTATRATLFLDESQERFRVIELRGQSRVSPQPGVTAALPEMQADDIDLAFYEGTQVFERAMLNGHAVARFISGAGRRSIEGAQVTFIAAPDGKTLTRLEGTDGVVVRTPASDESAGRTIRAERLVATGAEKEGLTAAIFSGGVDFVETDGRGNAPSTRSATSQSLALKTRGDLDQIDEAQFQGDVAFKDGSTIATADLGLYRAAKGELELFPASTPRRYPHVTGGAMAVDAREVVRMDLNTDNLYARGEVKTVSTGSNAASAKAGLFNSRDRVYGFSTEFSYDSANKRAHYAGRPAKLQQGESMIAGGEVTALNDAQDISASGDVESTFALAGESSREGMQAGRYRVRANRLSYASASGTATYLGTPVVLVGPDAEIRSERLVLTFGGDTTKLIKLEATTAMRAALAADREAVGDSLLYEAEAATYTLKGRPLTLRTRKPEGNCQESQGAVAHFSQTSDVPEWRQSENPGGIKTGGDVPCRGLFGR